MKRSGGRLWGRVIAVLTVLALLVPAGFTAVQMGVFSEEPPMEIMPMYPDAPTLRGAKHLRGLAQAAGEGYGAYVLFVIQMEKVQYLHPNDETDPDFGAALRQAAAFGVTVLAAECAVTPESMVITQLVPVKLHV